MNTRNPAIDAGESQRLARRLRSLCADALGDSGLSIESVTSGHGGRFTFSLHAVRRQGGVAPTAPVPEVQELHEDEPALPDQLLGRHFQLGQSTYIFRGIDASNEDYPFVVEDVEDGTRGGLRDTPSLRAVLRAAAATAMPESPFADPS